MTSNHLFDIHLSSKLTKTLKEGAFRTLNSGKPAIDFCSNDYLGFANHPALKQSDAEDCIPTGATGSRLISGNSSQIELTEKTIAAFHDAESALIFNSGYTANLGLLSTIGSRGDTFIYDEHSHASIVDGMRLSWAKRYKFRHNDTHDLERKLKNATGNKFIVIESVYSMGGDIAPLKDIVELSDRYNAALIVDEAHATGIFGNIGEGLVSELNLEDRVFARIHTFSKALGLHGAAVVGSEILTQSLINYARPFIYTTALPPSFYAQIRQAYKLLPEGERASLFELIRYFQKGTQHISGATFIKSCSPIQGILIGNNDAAAELASRLQQRGFFVKAILSPTVPKGSERIRICLHSFNTSRQIDQLLQEVNLFFT